MDNNNSVDKSFILTVIRLSFATLAVALVVGLQVWWQWDSFLGAFAMGHAKSGDYARAVDTVETITDERVRKRRTYQIAEHMHENGLYTDAAELFEQLGDFEDSAERYLQCGYDQADEIYRSGQLEQAMESFALLGDFSDSRERQQSIRYELAQKLFDGGEYSQAVIQFLALGDYSDSAQKAYDAAYAITGDDQSARDVLALGGMPREEMEVSLKIAERRAMFAEGAIDAGAYHTVLLHADGTVSACGDNSSGQCNVSGWNGVMQVAAGACHTVGLRSDGTVVATGLNTHGQCDVGEWRDVIAIAVGDSDTYGLLSDGTIVSTGYHNYSAINRASDVKKIFAGSYGAAAVTSSGAMITSHKTFALTAERELLSVALNTGYYAALQVNGKCLSTFDEVEQWKNIAFIDAGPSAVAAVDINGRVYTHFFRSGSEIDLSAVSGACQCAVGTEHVVFLMEDGTVAAFGDNSSGQCDVSQLGSW